MFNMKLIVHPTNWLIVGAVMVIAILLIHLLTYNAVVTPRPASEAPST